MFRPRNTPDLVDFSVRHGVTCLDGSQMHASDLVASPSAGRLAHVKVRSGGSGLPFRLRRRLEEQVTRQLYVRYAATECGPISMAGPGEHDEEEASGRPLPGVSVEVVDEDGRLLPCGQSGQIRIRAGGMATGYLDAPEASARRFREGWFYPGDRGYLRADGQIVVQGRQDDMLVLNGLNIFPIEIERVLERHPAVRAAAAVGLPSPVHGQIPVAAVELHSGACVTAPELQAFARQHLALRTPRRVLIMDALPRGDQGKLRRADVRRAFRPGEPAA